MTKKAKPHSDAVSSTVVNRRTALLQLGVGLSALAVGCGGDDSPAAATTPTPESPADAPDLSSEPPPDLGSPADQAMATEPTPAELLAGIDAIVVLMMENRSFDHYLGTLSTDSKYPGKRRPDGLRGSEQNPSPLGMPVPVAKLKTFTPADPPHNWTAAHQQWNGGKNDGFVVAHAGAHEAEAMGYYDREQLPFYYALADRFTVCDRWFASVMGPTWPNRYYLHAGSSAGKKDNGTFFTGGPETLWERLRDKKLAYKNYCLGPAAWYLAGFPGRLLSLNPVVRGDEFFKDAKAGTLPPFSVIDPDFLTNDDHPSHNVQLGQALIASVVQAIAQSPQWGRTLLVITYDEHGGFFDHVPPPTVADDEADFRQLGFRVPTLVLGGKVRASFVDSTVYNHASVAATVQQRFGTARLSARTDASAVLTACLDPARHRTPAPPPTDLPKVPLRLTEALRFSGVHSQPEMVALQQRGVIPQQLVDPRTDRERTLSWLRHGVELGAIELLD